MGIKTRHNSILQRSFHFGLLVLMALALNACADAFEAQCTEEDCTVSASSTLETGSITSNESNSFGGTNSGSSSSSSSDSADTADRMPSSIGISSGGNSSNGTSTSSGNSTSTGGFGLTTGGSGGSSSNNDLNSRDTYTEKFIVVDQLADKVVETESLFALQFIVTGAYPLKYQWYKKMPGTDQKVGTDQPVYYEVNTNLSHQGVYYAVVTDGNGNTIKSREATLHVVPGRNACDAGEYAPRYRMDRSGRLDWNFLFDKPYVINRDRYSIQKINPTGDSEFYIMSCNWDVALHFRFFCNGNFLGHVKYQCQNGKFKLIHNSCDCEPYDGGA